jgi:hypothetical protein
VRLPPRCILRPMTAIRSGAAGLARVVLCLAGILVALAGCAGLGAGAMSARPSVSYAPAEAEKDLAPRAAAKAAPAPAKPGATAGGVARSETVASVSSKPAAQPAPSIEPEPQRRLRVFSGFLELVVGEPERVRARIIDAVGQMGGYVESTTAEAVVVRVPAAKFDAAMEGFATLGEVRSRSVESTDVTESYADLERRIEIAKRTRARLYDLLEKSTDVEERVGILREIRRLTEEIEQLSSAREVLSGQIALSRITVRLVSRIDETGQAGLRIPFPWIAGLNPLRSSTRAAVQPVELAVAPEYAVFESGKRVRLEAADGTRLSLGAVTNEPQGDTVFWRDALLFHLGGLYRSLEPVNAGGFQGAILLSKDIAPFSYLVAVAVRGEEILVTEAFFPNAQARERRLAGVLAMLEGVKP